MTTFDQAVISTDGLTIFNYTPLRAFRRGHVIALFDPDEIGANLMPAVFVGADGAGNHVAAAVSDNQLRVQAGGISSGGVPLAIGAGPRWIELDVGDRIRARTWRVDESRPGWQFDDANPRPANVAEGHFGFGWLRLSGPGHTLRLLYFAAAETALDADPGIFNYFHNLPNRPVSLVCAFGDEDPVYAGYTPRLTAETDSPANEQVSGTLLSMSLPLDQISPGADKLTNSHYEGTIVLDNRYGHHDDLISGEELTGQSFHVLAGNPEHDLRLYHRVVSGFLSAEPQTDFNRITLRCTLIPPNRNYPVRHYLGCRSAVKDGTSTIPHQAAYNLSRWTIALIFMAPSEGTTDSLLAKGSYWDIRFEQHDGDLHLRCDTGDQSVLRAPIEARRFYRMVWAYDQAERTYLMLDGDVVAEADAGLAAPAPNGANVVLEGIRSDLGILDRYVDPLEATLHLQSRIEDTLAGLVGLFHMEDYTGPTTNDSLTDVEMTHAGHEWIATGLGDPGLRNVPMPLNLYGRQLQLDLVDLLHSWYRYSDEHSDPEDTLHAIDARTRGADPTNPVSYGSEGGLLRNLDSAFELFTALSEPATMHQFDEGIPLVDLLGILEDHSSLNFDSALLDRLRPSFATHSGTSRHQNIPTIHELLDELIDPSGWNFGFHPTGTISPFPLLPPIAADIPAGERYCLETTGGDPRSHHESTGSIQASAGAFADNFTVACWVKLSGTATRNRRDEGAALSLGTVIASCPLGALTWYPDPDRADVRRSAVDKGNVAFAPHTSGDTRVFTNLEPERWYHLAGVYTAGTARLYVNGALVGSRALNGAFEAQAGKIAAGGHVGGLMHFACFNRAISGADLAAIQGASPATLASPPAFLLPCTAGEGWYEDAVGRDAQPVMLRRARWAPRLDLDLSVAPGRSAVRDLRQLRRRAVNLRYARTRHRLDAQDLADALESDRRNDMLNEYREVRILRHDYPTEPIESTSAISRLEDARSMATLIARRSDATRWAVTIDVGSRGLGLRGGDEVRVTAHSERPAGVWPRVMRTLGTRVQELVPDRGPRIELMLWG